jgi:hypothetical protein
VPHDKKVIGEIRAFIQEHQHGLGNDMMMMDDDIIGFKDKDGHQVSINRVIGEAKKMVKLFPLVYFLYRGHELSFKYIDDLPLGMFFPGAVIVESTELYEKGIRYNGAVMSEDSDFYIQMLLNIPDVEMLLLPYFIYPNDVLSLTNFDQKWRNSSIIGIYLKYGAMIRLVQDCLSIRWVAFIPDEIEKYKLNGVTYSKEGDTILANIKINKLPGYEVLENWESNFDLESGENNVDSEEA